MLCAKNTSILLIGVGLVFATALMGCSPAPEAPDAGPEVDAEPTASVELPEQKEGSEPKGDDAPFGGAQVASAAEEDVDRSITDAAEFGDDALVAGLSPEGWTRTGNIEHYNVATLYTKINGRSELYMAYDVLGMSWVTFVNDSDKSSFLDLFVYDMRAPTNAFGIYSVEREADQPPADLGREGYRTGSNYYFWKGNYYGYINASMPSDSNTKAGLGIATALMQRISDSGEPVQGLDWLPTDGLIVDTVQFFKADAMSLDFLNDTFLGMYQFGENKVRAFFSKRTDEEEAAGILDQFATYGDDYADGSEKVSVEGVEVTLTDWGGDFYDVAFQIGPMVSGLSNVEGKDATLEAAGELIRRLQ